MITEYLSLADRIYAFRFDPERIERLVAQMQPTLEQVQAELLTFVVFLERVGGNG